MKKYLVLAGIFVFGKTSAQENPKYVVPKIFQEPKTMMPTPGKTYKLNLPVPLAQAQLSHTLPNGNKIYSLPQDNMPCVVPNISQFNMPVVKPDMKNYNIPNPAIPPPYKPRIFTKEQWKKLLEKQKKLQ